MSFGDDVLNANVLWLWLLESVELNLQKQHLLLDRLKTIENIYDAKREDFKNFDFLTSAETDRLLEKDLEYALMRYEMLKDKGVFILTIDSTDYPDSLRHIFLPPTVLYAKGRAIDLNARLCIGVVGTRKATAYGKSTAAYLSEELAKNGIVIVSGMALGIDTKAHEGALKAGAPTVAVLGCGVDIAYPKSNTNLLKEVEKTGMIISEYPMGTPPMKFRFPERNRIISGLSQGLLVVEADIKSGSLITARLAAEQGRDIFAVPGNINSVYSKGTNLLIKDGAKIVTSPEDIIVDYKLNYPDRLNLGAKKQKDKRLENLSNAESEILRIIAEGKANADTICERTSLAIGTVNSTLLLMELRGLVVKGAGGFYELNSSIEF